MTPESQADKCEWYVLVRPDNGYPVLVYPDRERAEMVGKVNRYPIVAVEPCRETKSKIS